MGKAELVLKAEAIIGEGSLWDAEGQRLLWVDIASGEIHSFDPASGGDRLIFKTDQHIGTVVQRERGGLVAAMRRGLYFIDEKTGACEFICNPEEDKPHNRFNDGKCDPAGRFWAGTMDMETHGIGAGSLYRLGTDLKCTRMEGGVTISNGIVWSPDEKTMYYTDTPTGVVWAYDYDVESGDISSRRTAVTLQKGEGGPDGITIDADGMLWVAQWGGWQVGRYDPRSGKKIGRVDVPAAQVASCALGGANLDELYITTARENLTQAQLEGQILAGSVFVANAGVRGLRANRFKG